MQKDVSEHKELTPTTGLCLCAPLPPQDWQQHGQWDKNKECVFNFDEKLIEGQDLDFQRWKSYLSVYILNWPLTAHWSLVWDTGILLILSNNSFDISVLGEAKQATKETQIKILADSKAKTVPWYFAVMSGRHENTDII